MSLGIPLPGYPTLLDIAKRNGSDPVTGLIDETTRLVPSVRMGYARTIKGTSYKTWVRTGLPISAFRNANQGANVVKSNYVNRAVETFILNPRFETDKAVADRDEFGAADYCANEASAIMEASIQSLGRQFYYGNNTYNACAYYPTTPSSPIGATLVFPIGLPSASLPTNVGQGFPGLIDQYNTTYQIDAGGTTANTATSVYSVKWGPKFLSWVYGQEGQLVMSDLQIHRVVDSNNNPFDAYCQSLLAYPGLQIGDTRGVIRIKNITDDSGHTLADKLIYDSWGTVPGGLYPDMVFMNRRALTQLRDSRTATNISGEPAPIPTQVQGVPIMLDDSIQNNEPINLIGAIHP